MIQNLRKRSYRLSPVPAFWLHPVTFFDYFCMRNYKPLWWKAESSELTASGMCGTWNAHSSGSHSVCWLIHLPDGRITFNQSDGDRTREKSKKEGEDASESKSKSMSKKNPSTWGYNDASLSGGAKHTCTRTHTCACTHVAHTHTLIHSYMYEFSQVPSFSLKLSPQRNGRADGRTDIA